MTKKRDYTIYVIEMSESIDHIKEFIADMSFDDFIQDKLTNTAVIRMIEVIGEMSKRIPDDMKSKYNDFPWNDMSEMSDKLIHEYYDVDYEIVWKVAKERLPSIKPYLLEMLNELKKQ